MADFKVQFTGDNAFPVEFDGRESPNFKAEMGEVQTVTVGAKPFEGPYEVTPKVDAQTLQTAKKLMLEDLTVKKIPCYVVGNTSGGDTVYIAKEVD